jgi:putative acetyltransferase
VAPEHAARVTMSKTSDQAPLRVSVERPDQPEVVALIDALDAYQKPLYPLESFYGIDMAALCRPEVVFVVAREPASGAAVGCGAIVVDERQARGELKRMFVAPPWRGRGVARRVYDHLEALSHARGCRELVLETGVRQPQAVALYERVGFRRCGVLPGYPDDPLSVFMIKTLASHTDESSASLDRPSSNAATP